MGSRSKMLTGAITGFSGKHLPLFPLHLCLTPIFKPSCLFFAGQMHQLKSGQDYKSDDRLILISDQQSLFND
jgi:hypothetical protein